MAEIRSNAWEHDDEHGTMRYELFFLLVDFAN